MAEAKEAIGGTSFIKGRRGSGGAAAAGLAIGAPAGAPPTTDVPS